MKKQSVFIYQIFVIISAMTVDSRNEVWFYVFSTLFRWKDDDYVLFLQWNTTRHDR